MRLVLPLLGLAVAAVLAAAAARAERSHRRAAERVLRDYAGVAGSELVRRTAFDVGFNGHQLIAAALERGRPAPPRAQGLVERVYLLGSEPPAPEWIRVEAAGLGDDARPFVARRHAAQSWILAPLDGGRVAAYRVRPEGLVPYFQHSLERGPLLPELVGDGEVGNAALSISVVDPEGGELFRTGGGPFPDWQVEVPFGDFYRGVLDGCRVRIALDPAAAGHALPGGLPRSQLSALAALILVATGLAALAVWQARRERAFARLRDDFVAGVSHDLRTPLAQMRLATETVLLGRARSPDEQHRFLESAVRESMRLGHLVDNLLDFSAGRAGRAGRDLAAAPRRLAPLITRIAHDFEPLAATRGVRLALDLDGAAAASVDEDGFTRLLLNLLDNAVKYGPSGGEVTVRLLSDAGDVELSVQDRGPGVPARERGAVFSAFHRLARDRRSATTGAGIGLALVRDLAQRHGGSCRVEDRAGGGARFVVRLPRAEVAA